MYVSMYVYVPGGALRPKRCVVEAPNSPRAAFFSFATFFSCWCFRLPALHSSEPPDFSPPFLPPALIASFPAFLLGMRVTCWESNLLPEIGHPLTCASQIREQLGRSRETFSPASRSVRWRKVALPFNQKRTRTPSGGLLRGRPPLCLPDQLIKTSCLGQNNGV